jgi:hypothetical protein
MAKPLRVGIDPDYIVRGSGGDYSALPSPVRILFEAWQALSDYNDTIPHDDQDAWNAALEVTNAVGRAIAEYEPQNDLEAAALLSCVYLDDDAEGAWGLWVEQQEGVMANVKAYYLKRAGLKLSDAESSE